VPATWHTTWPTTLGFFRRRRIALLLAIAASGLTLAGARPMLSTFMAYDDEGYVLLTLRNFSAHGGLYHDVYTQYGPLPYALYSALGFIGLPLDHTGGRLVTLLVWGSTALSLALLVGRRTRSLPWALLTLTLVFLQLWLNVREPTHPGSLVALLVALCATIGFRCLVAGRVAAWACVAGAGIAALGLTKINTGVFAGLALAAFALTFSGHAGLRRRAPWIIAGGLVAAPFVLMHSGLALPWIAILAVLFPLSAIGLAGASAQAALETPAVRCTGRDLLLAGTAAALVTATVLILVMPHGTSFPDLIEGVLLGPLRHPVSVADWVPGSATLLLSTGAASALLSLGALRYRATARARVDGAVVLLRLATLAVIVIVSAGFSTAEPHKLIFWWILPWLWVFVWPLASESPIMAPARVWLGFLALGQWLHAYPVPGSQLAWGSFLAVPLVILGAWEAGAWLASRVPPALRAPPALVAARGLLLFAALLPAVVVFRSGTDYRANRPLDLPGADLIRLPEVEAARYRILSLNAALHADTLFSMPGMFSFNLWSGRPTPTLANVTQWSRLLSPEQQQHIIDALEADPRACVIVDVQALNVLRVSGLEMSGPLYDYLRRTFTPAFRIDTYEFRVRKGRRIAPYFTAEMLDRPSPPSAPSAHFTLLRFPIALPPDKPIARVEITGLDGANPTLTIDNTSGRFKLAPLTPQGDAATPGISMTLPLTPNGPVLLSVYFDRRGATFSVRSTVITLRGEDGSELATLRLRR